MQAVYYHVIMTETDAKNPQKGCLCERKVSIPGELIVSKWIILLITRKLP